MISCGANCETLFVESLQTCDLTSLRVPPHVQGDTKSDHLDEKKFKELGLAQAKFVFKKKVI